MRRLAYYTYPCFYPIFFPFWHYKLFFLLVPFCLDNLISHFLRVGLLTTNYHSFPLSENLPLRSFFLVMRIHSTISFIWTLMFWVLFIIVPVIYLVLNPCSLCELMFLLFVHIIADLIKSMIIFLLYKFFLRCSNKVLKYPCFNSPVRMSSALIQ